MKTPYDFNDYKIYLLATLKERIGKGRGLRIALADAIRCQPGYLSRVFNSGAHLSLEQAHLASQFLGLDPDEARYFILLVEHARAGSPGLRAHFSMQIRVELDRHISSKRLPEGKSAISEKDQATYYGSWHYAAIEVATGLRGCETKAGIARRLRIPIKRVGEVVDFLEAIGLIRQERGGYRRTNAHMHLGVDSPMINKHHINWRVQAIQSLDNRTEDDFHYATVFTISGSGLLRIKALLAEAVESTHSVIAEDREDEAIGALVFDLFHL